MGFILSYPWESRHTSRAFLFIDISCKYDIIYKHLQKSTYTPNMILHFGIVIIVNIDGQDASLRGTENTLLTLIGPRRIEDDPWSTYSPFGRLPEDGDNSQFAQLYRKLATLKEQGLDGPFGNEPHPMVERQFIWTHKKPAHEAMQILSDNSFEVKVIHITHKGDDAAVEEAKAAFAPWITTETVIDPNPKIEKDRINKERLEEWEKRSEIAAAGDRRIWRYVYLPIIVLCLASITYAIAHSHWWTAGAIFISPFLMLGIRLGLLFRKL
jgi:hypothetical protein